MSIHHPVEVEKHYYSVPRRFARAEVEVRLTASTVNIFRRARGSPRISA
ncbi:Mu transposase domain-containing protein [Bradyrhizobium sp. BEA-2-5]